MIKKKKSRKEQIISLRKEYYLLHNLLYFDLLLTLLNIAFWTMYLNIKVLPLELGFEFEKVIEIPEWESIIVFIYDNLRVFNMWFLAIHAFVLFLLPVFLAILILLYERKRKQLPKIYKIYLPDKLFKLDYFAMLMGMINGFFIFTLILYLVHNPIGYFVIPLSISFLILIFFLNYQLMKGEKSQSIKRKFILGTIFFISLLVLTYLSV